MTQTILNCNEIPQGKIYPVGDLRTAKSIEQLCEYVDAGHPIACCDGIAVTNFKRSSFCTFCFDFYNGESITDSMVYEHQLLDTIKLAPLAYRNGRPLHLWDRIATQETIMGAEKIYTHWNKDTITLKLIPYCLKTLSKLNWRFAAEVIE